MQWNGRAHLKVRHAERSIIPRMVADAGPEYAVNRPIDAIRVANPWRPFAHLISVLSRAVEELSSELHLERGDRLLDYGCADRPYDGLFPAGVELVSADLRGNPVATIELTAEGTVPVADASFDAVMSTQVLEHVERPHVYLAECYRVLRPGGRLLLSTHGMFYLHPDPNDFWRWTSQGLVRMVEEAGLQVVRHEGIFGTGALGVQMALDSVIPRLPRRARSLAVRLAHPVIARIDRRQSPAAKRLNACVFAVVAERPLSPE